MVRGQLKSCARCRKIMLDCPGKGVAKDCTGDRVLLSAHMKQHWQDVGFVPDTGLMNEVDEEPVVGVR